MKLLKVTLLFGVLILAVGCTPAPTQTPTMDEQALAETLQVARTEAAQTVVAEITADALRNPSATPTNTPLPTMTATSLPTNTPVPVLPTATPRPVITITNTPAAYQCAVELQVPEFGKDFPPRADFDAKWVVKNTGIETWDASGMDYFYSSGARMEKHGDRFDLPKTVKPGETVEIVVDMLAPADAGRYTTTWAIGQGGITACFMSVTIDVQ